MCCIAPAAYVDYYADSYSTDDSLSFYFIFLTEKSVEISGTDNAVRVYMTVWSMSVYVYVCVCVRLSVCVMTNNAGMPMSFLYCYM